MDYKEKKNYEKTPKMEDNNYQSTGYSKMEDNGVTRDPGTPGGFVAKGPAVAGQLKGHLANKFMEERYKHFMPYKNKEKSE